MVRMDENMPFLLQYENVAWYDNGKVRILDRREISVGSDVCAGQSWVGGLFTVMMAVLPGS